MHGTPIARVDASVFVIPTDAPESDGTLAWDKTTLVLVEARAGDAHGLGYTYANEAAAVLIRTMLARSVVGVDAMDVESAWQKMSEAARNQGQPGLTAMAISAVDVALWDLKARLLGVSLVDLLGAVRPCVRAYGSGGFTSYEVHRLREQLGGWGREGFTAVKMKVGRHPDEDVERVAAARDGIGSNVELFVDANGAYGGKQALAMAGHFRDFDVRWFEEPVSSDDLEGLRLLRDRAPAGMDIAAGEYGYELPYFRRMLAHGAVDVLQADVTRCGGITGMRRVGALCEAHGLRLSAHCAPQLHAHIGCALRPLVHVEYFHDHERIERFLFEGALEPVAGALAPDRSRPGLGLGLKRIDAQRFAA